MAIQHSIINGPYIAAKRKKGLKALLQSGASNQFLSTTDMAIDMLLA
jgi:hypothetical protein